MFSLLAASLLWAFSFGLIKSRLAAYDPVQVACARLLLATLVFVPFLLRTNLAAAVRYRALALGVVQFGLMYVLYIASFAWLPAWQVALFTITTPLLVVGLEDFSRRRFTPRYLLAALVAVAGAAIVLQARSGAGDWRGILLLQGANLCFAFGQWRYAQLRRLAAGHDAALLGWMYGGAFVATLVVVGFRALAAPWALADWDGAAVQALLYLGLVPTGLGFYLWNRGAARTGAGLLAVANNLKVPLAVLVSWAVFGEKAAYGPALLGLVVMIGALVLAEPQRQRD